MFGGAYNTMAALHGSTKTQGGPVTVGYNMAVCPYNNTLHGSKSRCHCLHQMLKKKTKLMPRHACGYTFSATLQVWQYIDQLYGPINQTS